MHKLTLASLALAALGLTATRRFQPPEADKVMGCRGRSETSAGQHTLGNCSRLSVGQ